MDGDDFIKFNYKPTIRRLLAIFIFTAVLAFALLQVTIYILREVDAQKKNLEYNKIQMEQISKQIVDFKKQISEANITLCYNELTQSLLMSDNALKWFNSINDLRDMQTYIRILNKNVVSIEILNNMGKRVSTSINDRLSVYVGAEEKANYFANSFKKEFITPTYLENNSKYYFSVISPIFNAFLSDEENGFLKAKNKIGVGIFRCNTEGIQRVVKQKSISISSRIFVIDSENKLIATNTNIIQGNLIRKNIHFNKDKSVTFESRKYVYQEQYIPEMNWIVMSLTPDKRDLANLEPPEKLSISMLILISTILTILYKIIDRSIARPIADLNKFLKSIGEGESIRFVEIRNNNEISELIYSINSMLDKIKDTNRKVFDTQLKLYEVELAKKQSELIILQSQLNPHFLYNTLECLRSIGLVKKVEEVVQISSSLSKILRYSIKGHNIVTVNTELSYIEDYINIIQIRFGWKYSIEIEIDSEIEKCLVIKMLLQPIVENAFYHGLEQSLKSGRLRIIGYKINSDNHICFKIIDNGIGMSVEKVAILKAKLKGTNNEKKLIMSNVEEHLGILNINRRIKLIYGNEFGIDIESVHNEGTTVTIVVPKII